MNIHLPETDKQYYLLISEECIYEKAKELNIPVIYCEISDLNKGYVDELLKSARENSKTIIGILYDTTEENECWSFIPSDNGEYSVVLCNIFGRRLNDRKRIKSRRIAAERLPEIIKIIEDILTDDGFLKTTDYEGRCGNCHSRIGDNDLYCRLCGTKRGEGTFEPYANLIACVYGPPIKTVFKCNACGHSWEITVLGGDKSKFCPQCGKETVRAVEEIGLDFDEKTVLFKREYPEQETEKGDDK